MCLNMTETSYVARYLGIGGLCCQKAFLAMETRECWPIGMPVSLSTTWYLLMAEQTVFTTEKEYLDSNRLQIYLTIRGTGAHWGSIPWLSQNLANWHHPDLYVPLVPFLMWFLRKPRSCSFRTWGLFPLDSRHLSCWYGFCHHVTGRHTQRG